ncbi:hypothetical protein E2C01_049006 [Portunus trituberculatus]|uniref:Uncharacterized protein n=1 Tax=Portunus trituberculatus TaxID=210409 RepID=A0A5B7GCS2_PORTR|nr:hypothetical protein [Portunus trituberculatus]
MFTIAVEEKVKGSERAWERAWCSIDSFIFIRVMKVRPCLVLLCHPARLAATPRLECVADLPPDGVWTPREPPEPLPLLEDQKGARESRGQTVASPCFTSLTSIMHHYHPPHGPCLPPLAPFPSAPRPGVTVTQCRGAVRGRSTVSNKGVGHVMSEV